MKDYIDVNEKLPFLEMLPLSFQHLFAMFGSTVLVPYLLHVDPSIALFMNGIGTILYLFICKGRIPAYLGSSFAFIAPVLSVMAVPSLGYAAAQGGFIVFGIIFVLLSQLVRFVGVKWIDVLFPPAAMGAIIAIIGLELAPVAMSMAGIIGDQWQTKEFAKLGAILWSANEVSRRLNRLKSIEWLGEDKSIKGMIGKCIPARALWMPILYSGFVILQPDMGTAVLITGFAMLIMFYAGAKINLKVIGGIVLIAFIFVFMSPYRWERVVSWWNPWKLHV